MKLLPSWLAIDTFLTQSGPLNTSRLCGHPRNPRKRLVPGGEVARDDTTPLEGVIVLRAAA